MIPYTLSRCAGKITRFYRLQPNPLKSGAGICQSVKPMQETNHHPPTDSRDNQVVMLYANTRLPIAEIARRVGVSRPTIYAILERHGVARHQEPSTGDPPNE